MTQETLDVREFSSAEEAAEAVRGAVRGIAEDMGQDPDLEVNLKEKDGRHVLYWEGGPESWAIKMSGGESIWFAAEPQVAGFYDTDAFWAECKNSYALEFGDY